MHQEPLSGGPSEGSGTCPQGAGTDRWAVTSLVSGWGGQVRCVDELQQGDLQKPGEAGKAGETGVDEREARGGGRKG